MQLGICAGFGSRIAHELPALAARGIRWVRQELNAWDSTWYRRALMQEFVGAPVRPLFLLVGAKMGWGRHGTDQPVRVDQAVVLVREVVAGIQALGLDARLEIGNEPDLAVVMYRQPEHVAQLIASTRDVARDAGFSGPIITGGISNLNDRGLGYLDALVRVGIPDDVWIGIHRYPALDTDYERPHRGFDSRAAEWDRLRQIIGDRPVAVTEVGCHTYQSSETHQAHALQYELEFFAARGAEMLCVYQLNDAATVRSYEDAFGISRGDGAWKPAADVLRAWTAEQEQETPMPWEIVENPTTLDAIVVKRLLEVGGHRYVILPNDEVLSMTPEWRLETRPPGHYQAWERLARWDAARGVAWYRHGGRVRGVLLSVVEGTS